MLTRPNPCSAVLDPQCVQTVDKDESHPFGPPLPDLPAEIGGNVFADMAKAFQEAVGWLVSNTASWWVKTPSPNLENEAVVPFMQALIQPLTIAVALFALLIVAAKMILTRKGNPLVDAGGGLAVLATVTVIGAVLPTKLLQWGDEWSGWVLSASAKGGFAERMSMIVVVPTGVPAVLTVILCLVALFLGIIQALLLLFRSAALIILAGLLPLAAAGMITPATQPWFKRVAGWILALIFYKPAAAMVYATAFALIGNGKSVHSLLMGFAMMLISLIAFPVLLKFFTWTTGGGESSSGGGFLGAVLGGATAVGTLRSYGALSGGGQGQGSSANEHADFLREQMDQQQGQPGGGDAEPGAPGSQQPGHLGQEHTPGESGRGTPTDTQGSGVTSDHSPSDTGDQGAPPDGGPAEPVGPAAVQAWDTERRRGRNTIRWMGNPTDTASGPTGADVGGEGGGA